ncbi:uncharacterized protein DSM5745_09802 [Aspergillus mulundensis]|uniref:Uncharacterized protein n=1 Tax=Aspergillus mulundensis TaxID=1810919 RepID=A0A3D8QRT5_9EURO|nr:hypothetical protein DSM5745_09802 [Aspergillus mulundensis]RDW64391.1 hypothetical protein DSM5745_09802 [Aspergillus mulundensis]
MQVAPQEALRADAKATFADESSRSDTLQLLHETDPPTANTEHIGNSDDNSEKKTPRSSRDLGHSNALSSEFAAHLYAAQQCNASLKRWEDDHNRTVNELQCHIDELTEENEDLQHQLDDAHRLPSLLEENFRSDLQRSNKKLEEMRQKADIMRRVLKIPEEKGVTRGEALDECLWVFAKQERREKRRRRYQRRNARVLQKENMRLRLTSRALQQSLEWSEHYREATQEKYGQLRAANNALQVKFARERTENTALREQLQKSRDQTGEVRDLSRKLAQLLGQVDGDGT